MAQLNVPPPCQCGCGGQQGHRLSSLRMIAQCEATWLKNDGVKVRCTHPGNHPDTVPHGANSRFEQVVWW